MSKRRQPGDIVWKKENAGFVGERLLVQLDPTEERDFDLCYMNCGDSHCCEWPNLTVLDKDRKPIGSVCHVSECQMEDEI